MAEEHAPLPILLRFTFSRVHNLSGLTGPA